MLYDVPYPFALLSMDGLFDVPYVLMLLLGLCIDEAITKMHFSEPFSLLSELRFSNLAVPEAIFQLFHGEVDRVLYVCAHQESYYVAIVLSFSLLCGNQLKICLNSVIPHLDCWAVIDVWSQNLPAFLLCVYPNFHHLLI
jgi:hypothetical protein